MKQEFMNYNGKRLRNDLASGVITAMSILPFALAFGALAGLGMPA